MITEAIACERKYLIEASERLELSLLRIRGTILIKLISSPNQAVNQELEEIEIIDPENNIKINRM